MQFDGQILKKSRKIDFFLETVFVCGRHIKTKIKFSTDLFELLPKQKENKKKERKKTRADDDVCHVTRKRRSEVKFIDFPISNLHAKQKYYAIWLNI